MKASNNICFSKTLFYFGCVLLLIVGYLIIDRLSLYTDNNTSKKESECNCPVQTIIEQPSTIEKDKVVIINDNNESPSQYKKGPIRNYRMNGGVPINIRTRGEPYEYQNIGLLRHPTDSNDIKPLYGRKTFGGSSLWNYYCLLNNHIQVKIPIIKEENCLNERGCKEILNGDKVVINNTTYIAETYPYTDYRYIPYV